VALRLLDIVLPEGEVDALKGVFREDSVRGGPWETEVAGGRRQVRVLVDAEESGRLVDAIAHRCEDREGFHLTIQNVEAAIPRPVEPEAGVVKKPPRRRRSAFGSTGKGLSREELLEDASDMARPTGIYFATIVLSTVVVAVGLLTHNTAAVVGAMVIAPLLGPNMGLALSTTLGDWGLRRQAVRSAALGFILALAMSLLLGVLAAAYAPSMLAGPEIEARTFVTLFDPPLALAAGAAGALALTTGVPVSLVGVMVAVALLPPTAVLGLMLGSGAWLAAKGAALLLATNVICINLGGALTFRIQGIRPSRWDEPEQRARAQRHFTVAIALLCALLVFVIWAGLPR